MTGQGSDPLLGHSPEQLAAWDHAHCWHPFTPMQAYLRHEPVIISHGDGVWLTDVRGRRFYDGTSSVWVNVHGHRTREVDDAIRQQLSYIAHSTLLGQANVPSVLLCRRLVEVAPAGLTRVFLSDNGATAVEAAVKMAIQHWANLGRPSKRKVLGFTDNYHGDTLGAMAVAPDDLFHWAFLGLLPKNPRAPYPHPYRCHLPQCDRTCRQGCLALLESTLREHAGELAAAIIEPVQGAGGIHPLPPGFLRRLKELCDELEVLLIVDEVATGFGRTGRVFACEHDGVTPDILCLGKGLTGGYLPVAATLTTERVFAAFLGDRRRSFLHGHSYTGNQLGCAAALASLSLLQRLLPTLPEKCALMASRLQRFRALPFVGDVRHMGMMAGIEIVAEPATRRSFPDGEEVGYVVSEHARQRGLLIRPIGPTLIFMPPLASTLAELTDMLDILESAWASAEPELREIANPSLASAD